MEEYAAKMQAKSDADLRAYVTGHAQYRDDAVLAALVELRRRGQPAPEEAALRPVLEAAVQQQAQQQEARQREQAAAAARAAGPDDEVPADAPALYSPGTIVLFSVMFSMLAGGVLLGLNLRRLRQTGALLGLVAFVLAYVVAGAYALAWAVARYGLNPAFSFFFNVPAIVGYVAWFWPRYVGGAPYRSRGWLVPFVVCLLLQLGLLAASKYLPPGTLPEARAQQF